MLFNHDTELTLRAACVLINTDRVDGERLADLAALDAYLDGFGWTGRRDHDAAELASVHRLRERLGRIWEVADDEVRAVGQVNALLSDTRAAPWLTRHAEMPEWHLHLASIHDPLWQRMGAEMAMALADLIRVGRTAAAQGLRRARLRRGADRPVPQPVGDVLRHRQLWQPSARRRLPGAPRQRGVAGNVLGHGAPRSVTSTS